MSTESEKKEPVLQDLVNDYLSVKEAELIKLKKGTINRKDFLDEAKNHIEKMYGLEGESKDKLLAEFDEYIFGYSVLAPLIDAEEVSDIRVIGYKNIRMKKNGRRQAAKVSFESEKAYKQFIDYIAVKNQINISNLNAIVRFTDNESNDKFILRFTLSMPLVNTYSEPYLCIRKVPKKFPLINELIERNMLSEAQAQYLIKNFSEGSTLICGGNSSGKTTLLNALKETIPNNISVLISQQADELTTRFHPDMMFMHSLPGSSETEVSYDLASISVAGLTMDVDFFIVGEIKGNEAFYVLNGAYTGQICAATIHAPSADKAIDKLVDYCIHEGRYTKGELMKMMECFKHVVFMKHFKVEEIVKIVGYSEEEERIKYEYVF